MAVNLSPIWGAGAQLLDNSGNVLSGGKIYTYAAGTTTQVTTYTSNTGVTANSNPIVLNSAGRVPYEIWLLDGQNYKFVLKDSNDVLIGTWDNLSGINSNFIAYTNQQEIQTATAGQTVFNLTTMQYLTGTNSLSVFVDGVNQYGPGAQYAYEETDSTTVTFASGLHVGAEVKFTSTQIQNAGVADASQIGYTYPATNAVPESVEDRLAQYVSVKDFGAVGDGVTDDSTAFQNAIDYAASNSGARISVPNGHYKINTPLNLTSDNSTNRSYVEICGEGQGTVIDGNTGGRLFDCVGSNFLKFRDFYVVATGTNPSNIIFQIARGQQINYCHHNRIENVTIDLPSLHTQNNGYGTIGLLNIEGEDNTYYNLYSSCNSPVMLLRQPQTLGIPIVSYVTVASNTVSFGQTTFVGKTLMQAYNGWQPSLHADGVNTLTFENAHFAGGTSPWNSDTTGTYKYAFRTGSYAILTTVSIFGLIESHDKFMAVQNNILNMTANVYLTDTGSGYTGSIIDYQTYQIDDSDIKVINSFPARRPFFVGTGAIKNTKLTGYNVDNSLSLASAYSALNVVYNNDQKEIFYGQNKQDTVLAIIPINVSTPGAIVSYVALPPVTSGNNNGFVIVKIDGQATTLQTNNQVAPPSTVAFSTVITLVSDINGTYTIGTPVTTLGTVVSGNASVALITGLTATAAVVSNVLEISLSGTASGSSAYTNGINVTGTASLSWSGFKDYAPSL